LYSALPYLEQSAVFQLPDDKDKTNITAQQRAGAAKMTETPISAYHCPSRRAPAIYPYVLPSSWNSINTNEVAKVARADYAANAGDTLDTFSDSGITYANAAARTLTAAMTGVSYYRSEITIAEIRDGTSHTYMVAEKAMNPDHYETGQSGGDNHSLYQGYDRDIVRWTNAAYAPQNDAPGADLYWMFGGPHQGIFQVAWCDGSVRGVRIDISPELHGHLGNRKDGAAIDAGEI
jgi:hypothetical protein